MTSYEEDMARTEYNAEMDAKAEHEANLSAEAEYLANMQAVEQEAEAKYQATVTFGLILKQEIIHFMYRALLH